MKRRMETVTVLRHPKERRSKCTLTPLEGRADLVFRKALPDHPFDATGHILLALDAPTLSAADAGRPLVLLDSTWRLLGAVERCVSGAPVRRGLPRVATAYPRKSKTKPDPAEGLASVEALFLARLLLGWRDDALLAEYRWADAFRTNLSAAGYL